MTARKKKIAIVVREETSRKCIGKGCLRAFNNREDSFAGYGNDELELVAFCDDGGTSEDPIENLKDRIQRFQKIGVEVVHLSTCNRAKNQNYLQMIQLLSESFEVVGYTHGSASRPGNQPESNLTCIDLEKALD